MTERIFRGTLSVAVLIDLLAIFALWRPEWQLWPPPGKDSWQYRLVWTLYSLLLPGVLGLALLDRETLPLDKWIGHAGHLSIGTGLVVIGTSFALWGIYTLSFRASLGLEGELVTRGPYRFTRNPQYVGDILIAAGLPILSGSVLTAIVAPVVALGFVLVPFAEKPWLASHYGEAYRRYKERHPRFLGGSSFQPDRSGVT